MAMLDSYQGFRYCAGMKYFSVTEVATALKVTRQAIFDRINRETIKAEKIGNQFVITEKELNRLKRKGR